jgi:hypothetical protein
LFFTLILPCIVSWVTYQVVMTAKYHNIETSLTFILTTFGGLYIAFALLAKFGASALGRIV